MLFLSWILYIVTIMIGIGLDLCYSYEFDYDKGYRIGAGSFGEVFQVRHKTTKEEYIMKVEGNESHSLTREAAIYNKMKGEVGFAQMQWFGMISETERAMVIEMAGKSIRNLLLDCNNKFSVKTTVLLAYQMITRLEQLHTIGRTVHRDIKPDNFCMGRGKQAHLVYLIDFGESYSYLVDGGESHIKAGHHGFVGTRRYASINAHLGADQSRRDDMISLGYSLMFMLRGDLPWQGLHIPKEERDQEIARMKNETNLDMKKFLGDSPDIFLEYMNNVNKLEFKDKPDYRYLKHLFKEYAHKSGYKDEEHLYDWEVNQKETHEDSIFNRRQLLQLQQRRIMKQNKT